MLHIQSWVSRHQMNYRLIYTDDFKLVLAPNKMNSLSFGFSYRYLDLGLSFTPGFLNPGQKDEKKVNRTSSVSAPVLACIGLIYHWS
jgi:hypothetical protein